MDLNPQSSDEGVRPEQKTRNALILHLFRLQSKEKGFHVTNSGQDIIDWSTYPVSFIED